MTRTEACLALNLVPHLGPVRLGKLLETFGSPEAVLSAGAARLRQVSGVGGEVADGIANWERQVDLSGEIQKIEKFGASVITQESPEYPQDLRQIYNPPFLLYVWGKLTNADQRAIGIVGSRKTSHYGLECAKRLSYQLAYAGLTVVSGLARGIDTAAHQGALAAKGRTIAVIGSGLMDLYPPENADLAAKIIESGAVVSEYPMEMPPDRQNFPYRNRIVAGWGRGLLVAEAGLNSGALITAQQAIDHGRLVYAVPGPINRPTSAGSNRLIQQGAKLVTCAADIIDDMQSLFPEPLRIAGSSGTPKADSNLSEDEQTVLDQMESGEISLDDLVAKCRLPTPRVSSSLLALEMKRLVKKLPGQLFVKLQ